MQVQLVNLEDSKLMKLYCLESGIHKKIFYSQTNHMLASFWQIEYLEFHLFEKKNFERVKSHLEENNIKYELVKGKLDDQPLTDNWIKIIEKPNDFYFSVYNKNIKYRKKKTHSKKITSCKFLTRRVELEVLLKKRRQKKE